MDARINFFTNPVASKASKHIRGGRTCDQGLDSAATTQELVRIRASQINGCGFCLDMHTKEAAHAGETPKRLNLVATWREATVFTDAERAALELAEQGTRIADGAGGVTDDGLGERRAPLRRGSTCRTRVHHRDHQRVQPRERDAPETRRQLHGRASWDSAAACQHGRACGHPNSCGERQGAGGA